MGHETITPIELLHLKLSFQDETKIFNFPLFDRLFNIPALSLLDGLFISALYGYIKPEKEIYEAFFKKFSLVPEECFFIDDNAVNIEAAKKLGMDGYVYKAPDISGLKTRLSSLGVKI